MGLAREQKTENIFWPKTPLLLIKSSGQSNFKHLALFFYHLCILHLPFVTPFSDTDTNNMKQPMKKATSLLGRYRDMLTQVIKTADNVH